MKWGRKLSLHRFFESGVLHLGFLSISFRRVYLVLSWHLRIRRIQSDVGEGARGEATTSKDGSRRANYPISIRRGGDKE